jgi:hypothetical protein
MVSQSGLRRGQALKALEVTKRLEFAGFKDYHVSYTNGYAVLYFDAEPGGMPITKIDVPCVDCDRLKCKPNCRKYKRMMRGGG